MHHFVNLIGKAKLDGKAMALSEDVIQNIKADKTQIKSMLDSLATGNLDEFVARAQALGVRKEQANRAIQDTAALAAIIMQAGDVASW